MTSLSYVRSGPQSDLPLLLIHAMPLDSSMWDTVREHLEGIDVIAVDVPGFGGSSSGEEYQRAFGFDSPHIDVIVEALKVTVDSIGVDSLVLAGMSMGGMVAAGFAQKYPEYVAGLGLMDTNIAQDPPSHEEMRLKAIDLCRQGKAYEALDGWLDLFLSPSTGQEVRSELDAHFRTVDPQALAWLHEAMMNRDDARGALTSFSGPIMLERGKDDATCSRETLEEWKNIAPRARIVEIPGAGHFVANEQPELLAQELMELYMQTMVA